MNKLDSPVEGSLNKPEQILAAAITPIFELALESLPKGRSLKKVLGLTSAIFAAITVAVIAGKGREQVSTMDLINNLINGDPVGEEYFREKLIPLISTLDKDTRVTLGILNKTILGDTGNIYDLDSNSSSTAYQKKILDERNAISFFQLSSTLKNFQISSSDFKKSLPGYTIPLEKSSDLNCNVTELVEYNSSSPEDPAKEWNLNVNQTATCTEMGSERGITADINLRFTIKISDGRQIVEVTPEYQVLYNGFNSDAEASSAKYIAREMFNLSPENIVMVGRKYLEASEQ